MTITASIPAEIIQGFVAGVVLVLVVRVVRHLITRWWDSKIVPEQPSPAMRDYLKGG